MIIGSGTRLRDAVRVVTDGTLSLLSKAVQGKSSSLIAQLASSAAEMPSRPPHHRNHSASNNTSINGYTGQYSSPYQEGAQPANSQNAAYMASESQNGHQTTPYPAATQYYSAEPPSASSAITAYATENQGYPSYQSASSDSVEAPLLAAFAAQASQVAPGPSWRPAQSNGPQHLSGTSQSWQQWTTAIAGNLEPQDYYNAEALMSLGGKDLSSADGGASLADLSQASLMQAHVQSGGGGEMAQPTGAWPLNIFDIGTGGGSA
jgi:hypothetical protein